MKERESDVLKTKVLRGKGRETQGRRGWRESQSERLVSVLGWALVRSSIEVLHHVLPRGGTLHFPLFLRYLVPLKPSGARWESQEPQSK